MVSEAIGTVPRALDAARVQALSEEWRLRAQDLGQPSDRVPGAREDSLNAFMAGALADPLWGPVLRGIFSASPFLSDLALKHPTVVMETARAGAGAVVSRLIVELAKPIGDDWFVRSQDDMASCDLYHANFVMSALRAAMRVAKELDPNLNL